MSMAGRKSALLSLASALASVVRPHPVRVAIDGRSAAGKTTLADELAGLLVNQGRAVIRVSVDDFRAPPDVRYARGHESPEGYYFDSCDLELLRARLLEALGPG